MLEKRYKPIEVDFSIPRLYERDTRYGKWCRFLLRITNNCSLVYYYINDTVYNDQIDEQLKSRDTFPEEEWNKYFSNTALIKKILKETSDDIGRINYHYIPDDSLYYLLWDDIEDIASFYLETSIKEKCKIQIPASEIIASGRQMITLKDFFKKFIE